MYALLCGHVCSFGGTCLVSTLSRWVINVWNHGCQRVSGLRRRPRGYPSGSKFMYPLRSRIFRRYYEQLCWLRTLRCRQGHNGTGSIELRFLCGGNCEHSYGLASMHRVSGRHVLGHDRSDQMHQLRCRYILSLSCQHGLYPMCNWYLFRQHGLGQVHLLPGRFFWRVVWSGRVYTVPSRLHFCFVWP